MGFSSNPPDANFPIDYAIEVDSIPSISAVDVLENRVPREALAGKDVLIGTGSEILKDNFFIPGYGRAPGVKIHALGAETLKRGTPVTLGWWPGCGLR